MRSVVTIQANNDERRRWRRRRLHNSTKRPKGIKIQTKTHTPHEIATTIIKHAQIHNSMPLPNVYMEAMSVFLSFIVSIDEKNYVFYVCSLFVSRRNIHTHNELFSCCWFLSSTMLSMVGWFLMDSFICSFALFLSFTIFSFNSRYIIRRVFFLLFCLLVLSLFEPNLFAARWKTKKISNLIFRSRCTLKSVFRWEYLPGFDGIGLTIVSYFSLVIQF